MGNTGHWLGGIAFESKKGTWYVRPFQHPRKAKHYKDTLKWYVKPDGNPMGPASDVKATRSFENRTLTFLKGAPDADARTREFSAAITQFRIEEGLHRRLLSAEPLSRPCPN